MFLIDQYKSVSEKILITMTPTAGFTVGFSLAFTGTVSIDFKDGGGIEALTSGVEKTNTYAGAGTYIAEITGDLTTITEFIADNCRIVTFDNTLKTGLLTNFNISDNIFVGNLNLTLATISETFIVSGNAGLTGFTFAPAGNGKMEFFYFQDCNVTGNIDFQTPNITVGDNIRGYNNSNFTGFTFAASGNTLVDNLRIYSCNIATIDFSNVPLGGIIYVYNNVLTSITFAPVGNGSLSALYVYGNSLPDVDFSGFTTGNPLLYVFNNSFSATESDDQIINVDATGMINGTLNIITGNAARTTASDVAYNNLIANGWAIV
ncbi:MAG: hypothetical protein MUP82_10380 [Candidatus Marinimicrobia bacterium]|nr:hypothetical protein [Candidatus Neomarinimicrobiota bacterium]